MGGLVESRRSPSMWVYVAAQAPGLGGSPGDRQLGPFVPQAVGVDLLDDEDVVAEQTDLGLEVGW